MSKSEDENAEDIGIKHLRRMVKDLGEQDSAFLLARVGAESDEKNDHYRVMTVDMDEESMMNVAVVALTSVGQSIIQKKQEENKYSSEEAMQTAAFFYGLKALSESTSQWAKDITKEIDRMKEAEQSSEKRGPRVVREDVTDSAGTADGQTKRRTGDGNPIH